MYFRHSHLYFAVKEALSSYRAYVTADFYCAVMDGSSPFAIGWRNNIVTRVLLVSDFTKSALEPVHDTCAAPILAVTSQLEADYKDGRHISAGEVAMVDMAVVSPDFARHRVCRALRIALAIHAYDNGFRLWSEIYRQLSHNDLFMIVCILKLC